MIRTLCFVAVTGCFSTPGRTFTDASGDAAIEPNLMFVTSRAIEGYSVASPLDADAHCNVAATAAGLPGRYVAWMSSAGMDARDRLGTARAWVRTDGQPFADRVSDILQGRLLAPPRIDEHGVDVWLDQQFVFTGTLATGLASGLDCGGTMVTAGVHDAAGALWTNVTSLACSTQHRLYCFGVDRTATLPAAEPTGRLAFLGSTSAPRSTAALDATCNADAAAAGLPGTYRALVATTTDAARARVSSGGESWYRPDGILVASSDLLELVAPLNVTAAGDYVAGNVFFGAKSPSVPAIATENCTDWTLSGGDGTSTGSSLRSAPSAFSGEATHACGTPQHVYCFQTL